MIRYIKHQFEVIKAVAFVTYKEWNAYRSHSMVSIFVGPVYFIVQYFIWTAVYSDKLMINGMELSQMILYFGASTLIGYLTMDFADWNLQMLIHSGKFLTFAMRPIHHRFFAFSQKIGHRFLGFLFEFIPCYLIFTFLFGIDMIPKEIGWTFTSIALAFLMTFYVHYILGRLPFGLYNPPESEGFLTLCPVYFPAFLFLWYFSPRVFKRYYFSFPFPICLMFLLWCLPESFIWQA